MVGSVGRSGEPSSFEPPADQLSTLSHGIEEATTQYQRASSAQEKSTALESIAQLSLKLSRISKPPPSRAFRINFAPYLNIAMRIAVEMDLFRALPSNGDAVPLSELAKQLGAEEDFALRIARALASCDIIQETETSSELPGYSHTPMSRFLMVPAMRALIIHNVDNMLQATSIAAGKFYTENGFKNPGDSKNSPFTFAHSTKDESLFDILGRMPERAKTLNDAMGIAATMGLKELTRGYPFNKLRANEDGVCLVDVGGGRGNMVKALLDVYPDLKGKLVLQDLRSVIESGTSVGEPDVKLQPYNFFKGVQPVKGNTCEVCLAGLC